MDAEGIALFGEADAVIADAEALFVFLALERFHIARARFRQPVDGREDVHGDVLGDGANIGLSVLGEDDALQAAGSFCS